MAKKSGKLAIRDLDEIMKKVANVEDSVINYENIELIVKKYLSLSEKASFVSGVVETATSVGKHYPALLDFAFKLNVIIYFTNITMPTNMEKCNSLIYGTDIYEVIVNAGNLNGYLEILKTACREYLDNSKETSTDKLLNAIKEIAENTEEQMDGIDIKDVLKTFKDVNQKDEKAIVKSILEIQQEKADK